jgi:hypothetical protein
MLHMGYNAEMPVNKGKLEKREKILNELSDPESLDGSPTYSYTRTQTIKARKQGKLGKQYVPQWSRQFCYRVSC